MEKGLVKISAMLKGPVLRENATATKGEEVKIVVWSAIKHVITA